MIRACSSFLLVAAVGFLPPNAARAEESPTAELARRAADVRKKLAAPTDLKGFDDPDTKLEDVLKQLTRLSGVRFEVNEQAFKDEMIDDVMAKPLGREIQNLAGVPLESVLRRVLVRIPASSGTTFVVRGGVVEITTRRYMSPDEWGRVGDSVVVPPRVTFTFDKRDLQEALQEIADATGVNVVLDARVRDKVKAPVTATMHDVGVDTAVQLLANMADLTFMTVEDVLYVTTKQNARALRAEILKLEPEAAKAEADQAHEDLARLLKDQQEELRRLKAQLDRKRQQKPKTKKEQ